MMNDTLGSPPANDLAPLDLIGKALDLIADPKAVSDRVKELQTTIARNSAILASCREESLALDDKLAAHTQQISEERAAHEQAMAADRSAFDIECRTTRAALSDAEARAKAAQEAGDAERARCSALASNLENRIAVIHGAATAPLPAQRQ
jgi:hypothetical protein